MKKLDKKTKFNTKQLVAIERIALDPSYKTKNLSKELAVDQKTIRTWRNTPNFIEAVYDRYMEVAGKRMVEVIEAQINEAVLGNTQSATLVLKHFGKYQDTITVKIESPFDQFLKTNNIVPDKEVEDIGYEVVNEQDAIDIGSSFELPESKPVVRDEINDKPKTRVRRENKKVNEIYKKQQIKQNRSERYRWIKRAKSAGVELLGQGRPSPEKLRAWHDLIIEAENKIARGEIKKP